MLGRLVGHSKQVLCVDWMPNPDGDLLLTGSEDLGVKQWERNDVIPGDVFETFAEDSWKPTSSFAIAFNREGDLYGLDSQDHLFCCKDILNSGSKAPCLVQYSERSPQSDKTCGALSPDGETWAVCSYYINTYTVSCKDATALYTYEIDVWHNTLVWDPSGRKRFFAGGHGPSNALWNDDTNEKAATFDIPAWVMDGSWSADGRYLAIAHDENAVVTT